MDHSEALLASGFTILSRVMDQGACAAIIADISRTLASRPQDAIETSGGGIVGGRNLLDQWPGWRAITEKKMIRDMVRRHVSETAGLVRILYFDKPPGRGWSLAMHRDRTIAVAKHHRPPDPFAKPTTKAGVPHVEANQELLSQMLTLRLHLDSMHEDNGPLVVIPGSHVQENQENAEIQTIHCEAGDVFAMRPLLSHGSRAANPKTADHRRVLHLEIAPSETLPGQYQWHRFEPLS